MKKHWQWNERTRMLLTLELAVSVPAAALIVFSALRLNSMQRDRAVEAAIQRDFYQVLAISEKQMGARLIDMVDKVRQQFPTANEACSESFDHLLDEFPYAAHLLLYNPHREIVFRSRQSRMGEADFRAETEELEKVTP